MPEPRKPLDAGAAALRVREMFEEVHGAYGVLGFELGSVTRKGDEWLVECSFWPGLGTREKVSYRVRINAGTGAIIDQQKLSRPA